jgi:hypothetical protein
MTVGSREPSSRGSVVRRGRRIWMSYEYKRGCLELDGDEAGED